MISLILGTLAAATVADATTQPAKTDEEVWALAERVKAPEAYMAYWKRFRTGAHADEAVKIYWQLKGLPVPPPAPPPPHRIVVPRALAPNEVDPCTRIIIDYQLGHSQSDEVRAYLAVEQSNRIPDYEAYLSKFPAGLCRQRAMDKISTRQRLRASFSQIPGFGPLAAQAKTRAIFIEEDYPVLALKNNEQGRVSVEWEVAEDGIAESCRVTQSSGSATLDDATCRIITRRIRYDPARDANGVPVRSTDKMTTVWALPEESPPASDAKE
jgi:TonB family protein